MSALKPLVLERYELASVLKRGEPVLLPTDTVPALASIPDKASVLWSLKRRPSNKPFVLMGATHEELFAFASSFALKDATSIARSYWPGALTMVLPARGPIVDMLNPGGSTLGMRVPDCNLTRSLLQVSGPLATTSANHAGEPSSLTAHQASDCFPELSLLGPTPWPKCSRLASSVIAWESEGGWKLLRKGEVVPKGICWAE